MYACSSSVAVPCWAGGGVVAGSCTGMLAAQLIESMHVRACVRACVLAHSLTHLPTAQMGPVSAQKLASLVREGVLCDSSYVYEDGAEDWVTMASVRALLSTGLSELGDGVQVD